MMTNRLEGIYQWADVNPPIAAQVPEKTWLLISSNKSLIRTKGFAGSCRNRTNHLSLDRIILSRTKILPAMDDMLFQKEDVGWDCFA
jgi:hypothetical protein